MIENTSLDEIVEIYNNADSAGKTFIGITTDIVKQMSLLKKSMSEENKDSDISCKCAQREALMKD